MKWVDYRERLGLGFNDSQKYEMLKNKIFVFLETFSSVYETDDFSRYLIEVGEPPSRIIGCTINGVINSFQRTKNLPELISKYIAFHNTFENPPPHINSRGYYNNTDYRSNIICFLKRSLDDLKIKYEIFEDNEGVFVFPTGVEALDHALVSEVFAWLKSYPLTEKAWSKALRAYSEGSADNASDIADLFRKALESFFKEFFGNDKALENNKAEYGSYLKSHGVPAEIRNNLESVMQAYTNYMNAYAKHNDKTGERVLEYLMYQTGNIIRLLITLQQAENEEK